MAFPHHKTKLVCTIGPASSSPATLRKMLLAGMDVARLNFSHGDFESHRKMIEDLRDAAEATGKPITIMADLSGPKMRIGNLEKEPILLRKGAAFTLSTDRFLGNEQRCPVEFPPLPNVVKPGDILYLNDGIIQIKVTRAIDNDVECQVVVGGELRSRKGLNFPGIDLGIGAFTDRDRACLEFALENGVDAISQSFVETAADIEAVRKAAGELGHHPFIIAKIERVGALAHIDEILKAADGIMVARGDLGVETPLESIAIVQKQLIAQANQLGKPVITATQMLESMVDHRRPTRAEATDVANAILDGTDCVMLSEESAMGTYPVEAVEMLAGIAAATEPYRKEKNLTDFDGEDRLIDLISRNVRQAVDRLDPLCVMVPTTTGYTARMISRFKLPVWIAAVSTAEPTCRGLRFSYGVYPVHEPNGSKDWNAFSKHWIQSEGLPDGLAILTEGPSPLNPQRNLRMEIIKINSGENRGSAPLSD